MVNSYTRFAATLLGLNVVTILIAGLFILRHFPPIHTINAIIAGGIAIVLLCVKWKWYDPLLHSNTFKIISLN